MPLLLSSSAELECHHIVLQLDVHQLLWGVILMSFELSFTECCSTAVAALISSYMMCYQHSARVAYFHACTFIWLSGGSLSQCYVRSIFSAPSMSGKIVDTQPQRWVFALKISDAFCFLNCHFSVVETLFNIRKNIGIMGLNKGNLGVPFSSSF